MAKTITPQLKEKFENPLKGLDPSLKKRYRNKALINGSSKIVIGILIAMSGAIINSFGSDVKTSNSRYVGIPDFLAILAILLPIYGILQLFTIKNRMEDYARNKLVADNPQLNILETERTQKLELQKSNFLKYFTFSLAGTLILASIVFAVYEITK